jgi:hypothetical protein
MIAAMLRVKGAWETVTHDHIRGAMFRAKNLSLRPLSPSIEVWRVEQLDGAFLPEYLGYYAAGLYTKINGASHHVPSRSLSAYAG